MVYVLYNIIVFYSEGSLLCSSQKGGGALIVTCKSTANKAVSSFNHWLFTFPVKHLLIFILSFRLNITTNLGWKTFCRQRWVIYFITVYMKMLLYAHFVICVCVCLEFRLSGSHWIPHVAERRVRLWAAHVSPHPIRFPTEPATDHAALWEGEWHMEADASEIVAKYLFDIFYMLIF